MNMQNHHETAVASELERLRFDSVRLQRLYPHLQHRPELRRPFMVELAALQVRADRLDALLSAPTSAVA